MKFIYSIIIVIALLPACGQKNNEMAEAIKSKDLKMVQSLAESSFDRDFKDKDGKSLLELAKASKNYKIKRTVYYAVNKKFAKSILGKWRLDKTIAGAIVWVSFEYDKKNKCIFEKNILKITSEREKQGFYNDLDDDLRKRRSVYISDNKSFSYLMNGYLISSIQKRNGKFIYLLDEKSDWKRGDADSYNITKE